MAGGCGNTNGRAGRVPAAVEVFGPPLLWAAAFLPLAAYNQLSTDLRALRAELAQEREARSGLVTRADLDAGLAAVGDELRAAEELRYGIESVRTHHAANTDTLDGLRRDTAAALATVRAETVAGREAVRAEAAAARVAGWTVAAARESLDQQVTAATELLADVDGLGLGLELEAERLAAAAADLDAARDDLAAVRRAGPTHEVAACNP